MNKQKQWMAMAWCIELEKAITAYEALSLRVNQGKVLLTFECLICKYPLFLGQIRRGFLSHPFFKRRSQDFHSDCFKKIYLPKEAQVWVNTVDDLSQVASRTRKLKQALTVLEDFQNNSWKLLNEGKKDKDPFCILITSDLNPALQAYKALETALMDLEKRFQEGWMTTNITS